jgi:hypothetical protein
VFSFIEFQYTTHGLLSPTEFCIFCDGCPDTLGAGAALEGGIFLVIQKLVYGNVNTVTAKLG